MTENQSRRSFNLDRTFCSGARCSKTETCDRYMGLVRDYAKEYPGFMENRPISVAEFADHNGNCSLEFKTQRKDDL